MPGVPSGDPMPAALRMPAKSVRLPPEKMPPSPRSALATNQGSTIAARIARPGSGSKRASQRTSRAAMDSASTLRPATTGPLKPATSTETPSPAQNTAGSPFRASGPGRVSARRDSQIRASAPCMARIAASSSASGSPSLATAPSGSAAAVSAPASKAGGGATKARAHQ